MILLRKADELNNHLLLIGDSIVGSIYASGVDVLVRFETTVVLNNVNDASIVVFLQEHGLKTCGV